MRTINKEREYMPREKYTLLDNHTTTFFNPSNGRYSTKVFEKGMTIFGRELIPFSNEKIVPSVATTLEGKEPNFKMVGEVWIDIPLTKLKKDDVNVKPINSNNANTTIFTKQNVIIGFVAIALLVILLDN